MFSELATKPNKPRYTRRYRKVEEPYEKTYIKGETRTYTANPEQITSCTSCGLKIWSDREQCGNCQPFLETTPETDEETTQ